MRKLFWIFLWVVMAVPYWSGTQCWAAKAPTDEQLKALCRDAGFALQSATTHEAKALAFKDLASKLEKQADISKISDSQVEMLFDFGGNVLQPYLSEWLAPTLQAKASQGDAAFAFFAWKYMPREDMFHVGEGEVKSLMQFLDNNGSGKFVAERAEVARDIIGGVANFKSVNWATEGFASSVLRFLAAKLPDNAVTECVKVFNSAIYAESLGGEVKESIRKAVMKQYADLQKRAESERIKKNCQTQIDYLEGPFAKGTLVGGKAPNIHFVRYFAWDGDSVAVREVKELHSLIGGARQDGVANADSHPVIMLDFWGTKCVPCLQSFPELAEIQQHFQGKDVVILGITSLQGYFVDKPNNRTVQCRNNPEKELSLFPAYMKAMGMNWNVAVSEEDVMNTDYGALAIPHVVLIDKQGNVRYNALDAEKAEKIQLIEKLLNE